MKSTRTRSILLGVIGILILVIGALAYRFGGITSLPSSAEAPAEVQLPAGFEISVFQDGLNGPRFMALGPDGVIYVADRGANRIVALPDADGDGVADEVRVFAEGLDAPHSLAYYDGAWFVGVPTGIVKIEDQNWDGVADGPAITLIDSYPTGGHNTRTVLFLPNGNMVVSVGSSCNVCEESDFRRAAVLYYGDPDGQGERVYATGLRNAVGLAVHPVTGELWATNNGRDLMGDDLPPEAVYIVKDGLDYGWPVCHNGTIEDPDFGFPGSCADVAAPVVEFQAHSAPLGLVFYTGDNFPAEYRGDLFVAFHGSWNRSEPTGYKVVRVPMGADNLPAGAVEDFAWGWLLANGKNTGRPAGLLVGPDGALYISDDARGIIYRIQYVGEAASETE